MTLRIHTFNTNLYAGTSRYIALVYVFPSYTPHMSIETLWQEINF